MLAPEMLTCLALNVYFEARSESIAGQLAVAHVVMNRVESPKYPNNVCNVVKQGPISKWWKEEHGKEVPIRNRCQFSWWCDGKSDVPTDMQAWDTAMRVATLVASGDLYDITDGATHYHAVYVQPSWSKDHYNIITIGEHVFYKEKPDERN